MKRKLKQWLFTIPQCR